MTHNFGIRADLTAFDLIVTDMYRVGRFSTYEIAAALKVSQGPIGRSLRRSRTPRRSISEAIKLAKASA